MLSLNVFEQKQSFITERKTKTVKHDKTYGCW